MDNEKLISKIFFEIQKDPSDYRAYEDVFSLCRSIEESDFKLAHDTNAELRSYISRGMKTSAYAKLFDLYRRSLLFDAPYKFDSYLLYIEINRKPEERFYQPRRRILKQVVDNLQKLVDDELDELFISMPPRVGKTTILMFFVTWLIGRNSESSNLYSAYSDTITKAFYNGVLETIQDPVTYLWNNGFDTSPTWEDATTSVTGGLVHVFENTTKTGAAWGVIIKVVVTRGEGEGACYVSQIGGNFE